MVVALAMTISDTTFEGEGHAGAASIYPAPTLLYPQSQESQQFPRETAVPHPIERDRQIAGKPRGDARLELAQHHAGDGRQIERARLFDRHPDKLHQLRV